MRMLKKFVRLPWATKVTLLEVSVLLLLVRFGLVLLPYDRLIELLARFSAPKLTPRRRDSLYEKSVTWAASGLGGRIIGDRPCLSQALVVKLLLNRAGHRPDLKIGVTKDSDGELRAHAWVELNGKVLVGGRRSPVQYSELLPIGFSPRSDSASEKRLDVRD